MKLILLISLAFYLPILSGEVYKTIDEDGNVIFTDRPSLNSEEIKLKELKTTETVKPTSITSGSKNKNKGNHSYKKLIVSNPANGSAIRSNNGNVSISISLEPSLRAGHRILISVDGKEVSKGSGKSVSLTNLDRGTHAVTVRIIDSSSNAMISASSSFSILRATQ